MSKDLEVRNNMIVWRLQNNLRGKIWKRWGQRGGKDQRLLITMSSHLTGFPTHPIKCLLARLFFIFTQGHFFIAFRERQREREKHQWERDNHWLVAPLTHLDQDPGHPDQGSSPQPRHVLWQELNLKPFSFRTILQPTEPYQPGMCAFF